MTRTLFIGLDGATFTVLDHLTSGKAPEGVVMPFLKRLMREGFRVPLRSTPHPLTPPAWVSLMTGRGPGQHGVYDFVRFHDRGDEVYFTLYDARDNRCETIWSLASRQGRTLASLNFPMMAPPEQVNGSLIPGFVSWKHLRRNVHPAELYERVRRIPSFDPKELAWDFEREGQIGEVMSQSDLENWVTSHLPREKQWFRIAETLLGEDRPDLFAVMFDGTDKIQHQCWHVLDPALVPEQPTAEYARLRELVISYFRDLDGYIDRLVDLAGPGAQVFLASDHGFTGSNQVVRINRYLGELGYLVWREGDGSDEERRREEANFANLDWSRTTAFCPTPSSNGIYIRVADNDDQPGIRPADYDGFRAKLIEDLQALRHPVSDKPIIREILLREDVFPGAASGQAPDLTLVLSDFGFVSVRNRTPAVEDRPVIGTHHPLGIFIAHGPGIETGSAPEMGITDVPAVLLHSLGLTIPSDFEGKVPDFLLTPEYLMRTPVRIGSATAASIDESDAGLDDMPAEEREKVMNQLRALGYLED